jgi:hypothetical protein
VDLALVDYVVDRAVDAFDVRIAVRASSGTVTGTIRVGVGEVVTVEGQPVADLCDAAAAILGR